MKIKSSGITHAIQTGVVVKRSNVLFISCKLQIFPFQSKK